MGQPTDVSNDSTLALAATPAFGSHRAAIVAACLVVLAILVGFADTAGSIGRIWLTSDTFSHGVVVIPVALWLVWRRRAELGALPARPCLAALPLVGIAGALWLIGHVANANVVEHFALVLMIQSALLVTLGWAIVRAVAFPLLFLFFAVPFGEAFVPTMIDWTADFTVLALKATGIPVYREGNSFAVPTGHWAVAEACSGIRYLIASMMAGTLFAYLVYSSYWRRAAFIALSILVPIAANWLRAYLIVLLGHLSSNALATGVDHVIYGWIFFGVVLLTMFALGMKLRTRSDADSGGGQTPARSTDSADASQAALAVAAIAVLVLALPWSGAGAALMSEHDDRPRILDPVVALNGWATVGDPGDGWRPAFAGERVARRQVFDRDGQRITLYIAYYWGQSSDRKLVSASNTLLAPKGDRGGHEVSAGSAEVLWHDARFVAKSSTISTPGGRFDVVWWYWVDGHVTSNDTIAKAWIALSRLRLRGDDSAAVFVATQPGASDGGASAARFAAEAGESIRQVLLAARDSSPGPTAKETSR